MTLDQATRILKTKAGSLHNNAAASAYVHSYYTTERPDLLRPVGKARRQRTRDAGIDRTLETSGNTVTVAGRRPGDPEGWVGPVIAARLPGPASAYSIGTDGSGDTVVWQHSSIEGIVDGQEPVEIRSTDSAEVVRDKLRAQYRQRAAADSAKLRAMNEANKKYWNR